MIQIRRPTLVVVGTGLAGARVVEEVLARAPDRFHVRMFGAEPHGTYNRILLSGVLGGFADPGQLWLNPLEWYERHGVRVHAGVRAEAIDRQRKAVVGAGGKVVEPYDLLVLATGSRPFVPPVEGTRQQGVFVFRTLDDCQAIGGYAQDCDRAVVLGGGLLGLEAARGLLSHDVEVTVVETAPRLMPRQLDEEGAELLRRKLEALGVRVLLGKQAAAFLGDGAVITGLRFADGSTLDADMAVISCGIRPNADEARAAGLAVERGIVIDDQMRTSDPEVFALGECAEHRGELYGLVEPVYEQARVLADVLTGARPDALYRGTRPATTLKVMGVELTAMGQVQETCAECEVVSYRDPARGVYKKLVVRDNRLVGAVLLGAPDPAGRLRELFRGEHPLPGPAVALLRDDDPNDPFTQGQDAGLLDAPDTMPICNCNGVCKGAIVSAIKSGVCSVEALGEVTRAGTGCGSCQPLLGQLVQLYGPAKGPARSKVEAVKEEKDGLDTLPDILRLAEGNAWEEMTEADKTRFKWHGLFFRKPTPGHFMLRLRFNAGRADSRQFRVLADLSEEFGKGFCDLTTRQQVQMRWFTLADVPEIWDRLAAVGLHSKQTGMDNVRGVCGCPLSGRAPHELLDASAVVDAYTEMLLDNKEFTNLPRKFNVTITGCLENCCHTETQDLALVPSRRELDGEEAAGFNVLVGGKQGSGGYQPATPLDVFVRPADAARVCAELTRIFRDHGNRGLRTRARLAFLVQERGARWLRAELTRRLGHPLRQAGPDLRQAHHTDHLGIHPQKPGPGGEALYSVGLLVPVGRITAAQMRQVADLADCYGSGAIALTVQQNLIIADVPEGRLAALLEEPLLAELSPEPSPILRGLVSCTGNDYCHMALIETKGWAVEVARELERRTAGKKVAPLTIHWSGCSAGCGLHQVADIGLQAVRTRVNGSVVDAAHVCVGGRSGPRPKVASDLMYDVPCDQLADALAPLVTHLPRDA